MLHLFVPLVAMLDDSPNSLSRIPVETVDGFCSLIPVVWDFSCRSVETHLVLQMLPNGNGGIVLQGGSGFLEMLINLLPEFVHRFLHMFTLFADVFLHKFIWFVEIFRREC